MSISLKAGFVFKRIRPVRARWHIAREENNSGELPLCSLSGKYLFKTDRLRLRKQICPVCLEEAKKHGILITE